MVEYRFYWLTTDSHISHARYDEFDSDEAAMSAAERRIDLYAAVEVWQRRRMVGRVYATADHDNPQPPINARRTSSVIEVASSLAMTRAWWISTVR